MNPGFDDHFQKLIHEQACASLQTAGEVNAICQTLGQFRRGLIAQGFSGGGAEKLARELLVSISEQCWGGPDGGEDD